MMYNSKTLILLALFVFVAAIPGAQSVFAQDHKQAIRSLLEQRDADIKKVLRAGDLDSAKKEKLKALINTGIDFEAMAAGALGRHWEPLTADQKSRFVSVFGEIVKSQSIADLEVYESSVKYEEIVVDGNSATVNTTITYKEAPTPVDYIMQFHDGQWWVTDIVLKEVSTVEGYARSFQSVVRKRGFDSLMSKLEEKQAETASEG